MHSAANEGGPLVTAAIPTFNRPQGLADALADICGQTYSRIEILIGDNASTDPAVVAICDAAQRGDARVHVIRRDKNIGAHSNFIDLMQVASGEFFFWAADDDRHFEDFIQTCLAPLRAPHGDSLACVMTGFRTHDMVTDQYYSVHMPRLDVHDTTLRQLLIALTFPTPTIIYGLFRRSALLEAPLRQFDWADFLVTIELIAKGWKIQTLPNTLGYTAGFPQGAYVPKPVLPGPGRVFLYTPILKAILKAIWASPCLSFVCRMRASIAALRFSLSSFLQWERSTQPMLWQLHYRLTDPCVAALNRLVNTSWL